MWPVDSPLRFAVRALIVYGVIVLAAMPLRSTYSSAYRAAGNIVLYAAGLNDRASLRPRQDMDGTIDSDIVLFDRGSGAFVRRGVTPWRQGFLPTAALVALVLAIRLPWPARLRALIWGLIAVHLFVGLRLAINVLSGLNGDAPWCIMQLGSVASSALSALERVFVHSTTFAYVMCALIWLLVIIRRPLKCGANG